MLFATAALVAGCAGRQLSTPASPFTGDTGIVEVDGPVLVGFFPPPDSPAGGPPDADEFRAGLARLREEFGRAGVRVVERYTDTLALRDEAGGLHIYVPGDAGGGVGYYLAEPGRPPEILHGLRSADEIRRAAWRYFHAHARGTTRQAQAPGGAPCIPTSPH